VNPYQVTPAAPEPFPADAPLLAEFASQSKPRVWTVFVALAVAFVAVIGTQIVAVVGIVAWYFLQGGGSDRLESELLDLVGQPAVFMGLGLLGQITIAAVALSAAWLSPVPLARRLGFVRPAWTFWQTLVALVGMLVPFAVGMACAYGLAEVIPPDPSVEKLYENMTPTMALPFILFIAIAPGFSEEMLFRGYFQQRLTERWPAGVSILIASFLFALFHIQPHAVVFAFPLGIWLGMMAWSSRSIWPGVIAHATVNGLWNVFQIGARFEYFPEEPPQAVLIGLGIVGIVTFAWSLRIMFASK
jgi:membrane protease YdiL (CAAX protease family)